VTVPTIGARKVPPGTDLPATAVPTAVDAFAALLAGVVVPVPVAPLVPLSPVTGTTSEPAHPTVAATTLAPPAKTPGPKPATSMPAGTAATPPTPLSLVPHAIQPSAPDAPIPAEPLLHPVPPLPEAGKVSGSLKAHKDSTTFLLREEGTEVVPAAALPTVALPTVTVAPSVPAVSGAPLVEGPTRHVRPALVEAAKHLKTEGGRTSLVIRLDPPELGAVLVRLTVKDGQVDVQLRTPDLVARGDLAAQAFDVKQVLHDQGLNLASFDVAHGDVLTSSGQSQRETPDRGTPGHRGNADGRASAAHVMDDVPSPQPAGTWL
jgi:hypothetical protein